MEFTLTPHLRLLHTKYVAQIGQFQRSGRILQTAADQSCNRRCHFVAESKRLVLIPQQHKERILLRYARYQCFQMFDGRRDNLIISPQPKQTRQVIFHVSHFCCIFGQEIPCSVRCFQNKFFRFHRRFSLSINGSEIPFSSTSVYPSAP